MFPISTHKNTIIALLLNLCWFGAMQAHAQREVVYIELQGKVFKNKMPIREAELSVVTMNGYPVNNAGTAKNGKFKLKLPLNGEYIISIKYPFCYDKTIYVSTHITDKGSKLNWFFEFNVDMIEWFPKRDSLKTLRQPVAKIQYYNNQFGFDYDDEYTDRAQSQLAREVKQAERETSKEEQQVYIEQLKKEDRKRNLEALQEKQKEDAAEQERLQKANAEEARLEKERELKALADASKARHSRDSVAKGEAEKQRMAAYEQARIQRPAIPENVVENDEDKPAAEDKEETIVEKNRTIKKNTIYRDSKPVVYKRITYNWGGIYYFRNRESIGKEVYELEIEKK